MTTKQWFRSRAKELYHEEDEIEIDEDAQVSVSGDEGAYVEAWVWVLARKSRKKVSEPRTVTGHMRPKPRTQTLAPRGISS
jgi:hypothetical protein